MLSKDYNTVLAAGTKFYEMSIFIINYTYPLMEAGYLDSIKLNFNRFNNAENLISEPTKIFKALLDSKEKGTVIGITSPILGKTMCLTCIEDLILSNEGELIVVLKSYDINGYILPSNKISLSHIESVYPFTSMFQNPFIPKRNSEGGKIS